MHSTVRRSLFPFLWVLLSQLMFGAAFPRVPLDPPPSSHAPGFLVPPAAIRTLCAELIYGPVSGGSEGRREECVGVGWRVGKRVLWRRLRGRESAAIALACCLEPDALCFDSHVFWGLSPHCSSRGCWFIPGWMIYGKLDNSSFISYKQPKYLLQKIRLEDNHTSGHSSVKIYYVLGSVPF